MLPILYSVLVYLVSLFVVGLILGFMTRFIGQGLLTYRAPIIQIISIILAISFYVNY